VSQQSSERPARVSRQAERQAAISEAVISHGAMRIEEIAERFDISVMTVHRDLDELESRGLLRKTRGMATATSTSLVESSDVYRSHQQLREKAEIAATAIELIEPGQALFLDDSTTTLHFAKLLPDHAPLTVITNVLTLMNELSGVRGISLIALGGTYFNWCSAFMGRTTNHEIAQLRADVAVMSTAAITDDTCFHQSLDTVEVKHAMFDAAKTRILLADHTKFEKRALHALLPLTAFDVVIVDSRCDPAEVGRLRSRGVNVMVAKPLGDRTDSPA